MTRRTKRLLLGAVLASVVTLPALHRAKADQGTPGQGGQQQAPSIDPRADEILHRMSDFLAAQGSFSVHAESTTEVVLTSGGKVQYDATSEIDVQRPNLLRSARRGSLVDATLYYDGQTITLAGRGETQYATIAAPATIDGMIDFARSHFDIDAPGADLLYANPYAGLVSDVVSGSYIDEDDVDGATCHHLFFVGNETDWQVWVQDGERPLPRKYLIVSKTEPEAPEFEVRLSNWRLDALFPDGTFSFTPGPDARLQDFPTADTALLSPGGN
jgi:hypothetical protein